MARQRKSTPPELLERHFCERFRLTQSLRSCAKQWQRGSGSTSAKADQRDAGICGATAACGRCDVGREAAELLGLSAKTRDAARPRAYPWVKEGDRHGPYTVAGLPTRTHGSYHYRVEVVHVTTGPGEITMDTLVQYRGAPPRAPHAALVVGERFGPYLVLRAPERTRNHRGYHCWCRDGAGSERFICATELLRHRSRDGR